MKRTNSRVPRLQRVIERLHAAKAKLEEDLNDLMDRFNRGKEEHNAALLLINDISDNLPDGWSRKYDKERQHFYYFHSGKDIHF